MVGADGTQKQQSFSLPILLVVSLAIFTDDYIYASVIPILPFLLEDRIGLHGDQVQKCKKMLFFFFLNAFFPKGWEILSSGKKKLIFFLL